MIRGFVFLATAVVVASGWAQGSLEKKKSQGVNMSQWFPESEYVRLEISSGKVSDRSAPVLFETEHPDAISYFRRRFEGLSPDADLMKRFSPDTDRLTLKFRPAAGDDVTEIQVLDGKVRRPGGAVASSPAPEERALVADLKALLSKGLKTNVIKVPGASVEDKFVRVSFTGNVFKKNDEPGMPTVGPTNQDHFQVQDKSSGSTELVKISSGQTPPQPKTVSVGKRRYVIRTFLSSKNENIYGRYFEVTAE